ncbi:MAG: hypothetical protein ABS34_12200 [Opitutaceae bacterium BACL24 MAG-120322-bin51]|jgi:hypothetical protein|nr:MAG: hypothetical protein ABS34_12200 [Opitutaceae bacterium BACL24 MAG-120322-bin51]
MDFTDGAESVQFGVIPTQHTIERKNMSYICKVEGGQVKMYTTGGQPVRTFEHGAVSAVISGDEVHVTMSNGQLKVYTLSGQPIRTI